MKKISLRHIILFLITLCLLFSSACGTKNKGDETTQPLDKMINGLLSEDTGLYKSAFPPDYITALTEELSKIGENIDTLISNAFKGGLDAHVVNYGDDTRINYILISKEPMTQEELNEPYWDYYITDYNIPVGDITEAFKANFDLTVKGDESGSTKRAVYKLLKIDGIWYMRHAFIIFIILY